MQTPIAREIAQLSEGNLLRSFPALLRFIFRIVTEGRGNELLYNALREIRYARAGPYDDHLAIGLDQESLSSMMRQLEPRLATLGYRQVHEFASRDETKCVVMNDRLISTTGSGLRIFDLHHSLVRQIEVNGNLSNFVCIGERIYFVVDGALFSVTEDGEVRNENLSLSSTASTVLDQGIAADPGGAIVVAEYKHDALGKSGAYLYVLRPGKSQWETVDALALHVDKHCHIVVSDPGSRIFYVACGDSRKMLAVLDITGPQSVIRIVSAGAAKTGGYLCAAPWQGGLMCGTDYTGGTNFLVLVRDSRIVSKEALRSPFRRSVVTSIEPAGDHLLFAAWNMGHLPACRNGLLLKSPAGVQPLCLSEDNEVTFELFPSADGLVICGAARDRQVFGVFHRPGPGPAGEAARRIAGG
jgi:hypothetical protein